MSLDVTAGPAVSLSGASVPAPVAADVRVCRTPGEVAALRDVWSGVSHPDADLEVFLAVARHRPQVLRPHVVVLEREGRPVALLAARLEECELPAKFGYANVYKPQLRVLTVVTGGMIGPPEAACQLVEALLGALARREADAIRLERVTIGAPLHVAVLDRAPSLRRERLLPTSPHRALELPDSSEALLLGMPKNVRADMRRFSRRLAEEYGERMAVRRFEAPGEFEQVVADLEHVAATTYQRGLGAGFSAEHDGPLVRIALDGGWFRAWVLYLDGVPCAFEFGHRCGETFIVAAKGFDPAYGRQNVGKVVQLKMLEDLVEDAGTRVVDFGFGDADYKRRLATREWEETDVVVYGRTFRALRAVAARTIVLAADRLARRAAGRDRIARIKRAWRDRRTPANGS
jgi:CelD/BcsL family acetyltransferase involved in cellulose biosynthesis